MSSSHEKDLKGVSGTTDEVHERVASHKAITRVFWETLKARVGDKVGMFADTQGFPDGTGAIFSVFEVNPDGDSLLVGENIRSTTEAGFTEAEWKYQYKEESDNNGNIKHSCQFFFKVKVEEKESTEKPTLKIVDEFEKRVLDEDGQPIIDLPYTLTLCSGEKREGRTSGEGYIRESDAPPGKHHLKLGDGALFIRTE